MLLFTVDVLQMAFSWTLIVGILSSVDDSSVDSFFWLLYLDSGFYP